MSNRATAVLTMDLPVEALTEAPLEARGVHVQRAPRSYSVVAFVELAAALVMVVAALGASADGQPFIAVAFLCPLACVFIGISVFLLMKWHREEFVDDYAATVVTDLRGRRYGFLHAHVTACEYLPGLGGVRIQATDLAKPLTVYSKNRRVNNMALALATLEAEGRFAPPEILAAPYEQRVAWLEERLVGLQQSLRTRLDSVLYKRLMCGPLLDHRHFMRRTDSTGCLQWYLYGRRLWWELVRG